MLYFDQKVNKHIGKILFYLFILIILLSVVNYSKKYREDIRENSYISITIYDKDEQVLVLKKFTAADKVLAKKCINLVGLILKTNFNDFKYDDFYWMKSKSSTGNTVFYDIEKQTERANILIDYRLYPAKDLFYSQNLVDFGVVLVHELHHFYYLLDEKQISILEDNIIQKTTKLKHKLVKSDNKKINNELDVLVDKLGLLK